METKIAKGELFSTKFGIGDRVTDGLGVTGTIEHITIDVTSVVQDVMYNIKLEGKDEDLWVWRYEYNLKLAPEILAPELAWAEAGVRITKAVYNYMMISNLFNLGPLDETVRKQIRRQTYVFLGGNKISFNEKTEEGRKNKARVRHLIAMAEGHES